MENSARSLLDSLLRNPPDDSVGFLDEALSDAAALPEPARISLNTTTQQTLDAEPTTVVVVDTIEPAPPSIEYDDELLEEDELCKEDEQEPAEDEQEPAANTDDLAIFEEDGELVEEDGELVEENEAPDELHKEAPLLAHESDNSIGFDGSIEFDGSVEFDGEVLEIGEDPAEEDVSDEGSSGGEFLDDATVVVASTAEPTEESAVLSEPPALIRTRVEGGRVWLNLPAGASISAVIAGLAPVVLPAGVLWLSLGSRPTTAAEVRALCQAVGEAVSRPVAGVRVPKRGLAEGIRTLAEISVEFDGDEEPDKDSSDDGRARVLVVERTLRSGAAIRHRGDVLVYGDVNAGAEIVASGNIIVLGALRGLAWAGSSGDEGAMVIGLDLRPRQVRIGQQIAFLPERQRGRGSRGPEVALIRDDEIVLQEYRGRISG